MEDVVPSPFEHFLQSSGIHAAWQRALWLGWQRLGSRHLAGEQSGIECPQDVDKKHYFKIEFIFLLLT